MIASCALTRHGAVLAAIAVAAACGTSPNAPNVPAPSDLLSGSLSVYVDRADDYGYHVELSLHPAGGAVVTITNADLTLFAPTGVIVKPLDASILSSKADQSLTFPNEAGLGLATSAIATVTYVVGAGSARSLSVSKAVPTCWNDFEAHCSPAHVDIGQTSACQGSSEFLCAPMNFPFSGSDIQWQSMSPDVATVSKNGTLTGTSSGVAVIAASFPGTPVSHAFSICVGPSCKPDSLAISPQNDTLGVGATLDLQVSGFWAGQKEDLTTAAQWQSTNPAVGGFNTSGKPYVFTALAPGTTTITATYIGVTAALAMTVK